MLTIDRQDEESALLVTTSFQEWQRDTFMSGLLPVIGIAGTSGKSTVLRLLDAIFREAELRTATWSNLGVEIRGRRQRGELGGWALALSRLAEGTIDVAIQELHWSTIHAVGLPPASYPVMLLTSLRGSPDSVWNDKHLQTATNAAQKIAEATHPNGMLVLNGDDYSLVDIADNIAGTPVVVAHAKESPAMSRQLRAGLPCVWTEDGAIVANLDLEKRALLPINGMPLTLDGDATFQIANVMMATAIASSVGIDEATIMRALGQFRTEPEILPGSFNVWDAGDVRAVVNRLTSSWSAKQVLRSINPGAHRRQISVVGDLSELDFSDIVELGRVLGRYHGAIVLHSNHDEHRLNALRHGITSNDYPPLIIHLPTERKAINRALRTAREDDVVLMLPSGDPGVSCRAAARFVSAGRVASRN